MVNLTWVICQFGNLCTIEEDGMCPECVTWLAYFDEDSYESY